jgi:hypothetical protein
LINKQVAETKYVADVDGLVAGLSPELLTALRQNEIRYDRSNHRNAHLDQIERALGRV